MQITIISVGNMARGIATRALLGGHTLRIIDRAPAKAARLAPACRKCRSRQRPGGRRNRHRRS
jgi:8-hydroxy-5-deazaflavin:NADPH oxidoreductase